jgi:hypothetical protein
VGFDVFDKSPWPAKARLFDRMKVFITVVQVKMMKLSTLRNTFCVKPTLKNMLNQLSDLSLLFDCFVAPRKCSKAHLKEVSATELNENARM